MAQAFPGIEREGCRPGRGEVFQGEICRRRAPRIGPPFLADELLPLKKM